MDLFKIYETGEGFNVSEYLGYLPFYACANSIEPNQIITLDKMLFSIKRY